MANIPTANDILAKIGVDPKQPISLYKTDVGGTQSSTAALPVAPKQSILPPKQTIPAPAPAPMKNSVVKSTREVIPTTEELLAKIGYRLEPQQPATAPTSPAPPPIDPIRQSILNKPSTISQAPTQTIGQKIGDFFNRILPGTKPEEDPNPDVGIKIKVPFLNRVISRPNTVPEQILKDTIETPERIASTLGETKKLLSDPSKLANEGRKPAPVEPFTAKVKNVYDIQDEYKQGLIDSGISPQKASILSGIYAVSNGILDLAGAGTLVDSAANSVIKSVAIPEQQIAWRTLGMPADIKEAEETAKRLLKIVHPDIPVTGDAALADKILASLKVMRESGIPTKTERIVRDIARTAKANPADLFTGLPQETTTPFSGVAGYLPGTRPQGGILQPKFGLSAQPVEDVGRAPATVIDDLAGEVKKYNSPEDLVNNLILSEGKTGVIPSADQVYTPKNPYSGSQGVIPHSLSTYGSFLYHDTSLTNAQNILTHLGAAGPLPPETIYLANTPELAIGQGGKTGIKIVFDSSKVSGVQPLQKKPLAGFIEQGGQTDEIIGKDFGNKSVIGFKTPADFEVRGFNRNADGSQNVTEGTLRRLDINPNPVILPDGSKFYLRNDLIKENSPAVAGESSGTGIDAGTTHPNLPSDQVLDPSFPPDQPLPDQPLSSQKADTSQQPLELSTKPLPEHAKSRKTVLGEQPDQSKQVVPKSLFGGPSPAVPGGVPDSVVSSQKYIDLSNPDNLTDLSPSGANSSMRPPASKVNAAASIPVDNEIKVKGTKDIDQLVRMRDRLEQSLTAARENPTAHAKAYGPDKIEEYPKKIDEINKRIVAVAKEQGTGIPLSKDKIKKYGISYEESLEATLTNADEAKTAFEEFQSLDQILDFERYKKIDDLRMQASMLKDAIDNHPAAPLERYANKNGELPEVIGKTKTIFGTRGDDIVTELGFKDSEEARAAFGRYMADKRRLADMRLDLRREAAFSKNFSTVERILNKMKIKGGEKIPATVLASRNVTGLRDITGLSANGRDLYRNFKATFGPQYPEVKSLILDPFDDAKKLYIDDQKNLMTRLKSEVMQKFNIKRGSYDDELVMHYGEGELPYQDIVSAMGEPRAQQIKGAADWFRKEYDRLLDEVNAARKKLYPGQPNKLIKPRKNYFRHYQEMAEGFEALKNIVEGSNGIGASVSGISEFTLPKSRFLSFAQRRLGLRTKFSAIGGFLNYIPAFSYAKNIDPQIGVFRALQRDLSTALTLQEEALPPGLRGSKLENFLTFLTDFSNDLAGKTNPWDRQIQKLIGRTPFKVINWINSRVKANVILGNLSSSVAQAFNVPQGIASAKQYSIPGMKRTLAGIFKPNTAMEQSQFITERFFEGQREFEVGLLNKTKEFAAWLIGALDEAGTKFIWNSHYEKGIAEGVPDAIRYADEMTRSLVAGRGIGEVPIAQKSKLVQIALPFQLEVANLWFVLKDFISAKDFAAIATFLAASYLMNRAAKDIRGSDVSFDPINAAVEGYQEFQTEDSVARGLAKFGFRMAGEVLSNVPGGQTVASMMPENGGNFFGFNVLPRKELFGEGDPTSFGSGLLATRALSDPIFKLAFPFGGEQVKRTYQGTKAFVQGETKDASGRTQHGVTQNVPNFIKSVLFGKGSTKEAADYRNSLKDIYSQVSVAKADAKTIKAEAEKAWANIKGIRDTQSREDAIAAYNELEKANPSFAEAVLTAGRADAKNLSGEDRALSQLPVKGGSRARFIYSKMKDFADDKEAKRSYLVGLQDAGLLSDTVIEQIGELKTMEAAGKDVSPKATDKPEFKTGEATTSTGIISTISLYAKAIGTDPLTAFNRIFTGQHIRRIDSGAIIVDRMAETASESVRKDRGAYATSTPMRLDHTIPLELGGSNAESNLNLVPEDQWAAYTPVENFLGKLLRAGKIDKKTAQEYITGFKGGTKTSQEVFDLAPDVKH